MKEPEPARSSETSSMSRHCSSVIGTKAKSSKTSKINFLDPVQKALIRAFQPGDCQFLKESRRSEIQDRVIETACLLC